MSDFKQFSGPWHGEDQIVIGIDVGTTQSGVAFTYLTEGAEQQLHRVTHWPGQDPKSSAKVPSVIWYDRFGQAVSFGAEAFTSQAEERAADNGWNLVQYFKLHLHPQDLRAKHNLTIEPLPAGVPLSQVYANFLNYLLTHTQKAFESTIVGNARAIWARHRSNMIFVIAHPNGWRPREQSFLRDAAVAAGFTTKENAQDQIRFVTEAEASTHFCLHFTHLRGYLSPGMNFVVCDAGGSTVDTTLYATEQVSPKLRLGEVKASACVQAGGIFVDKTAKSYLERLFEDAGVSSGQVDEYLAEGIPDFELQGKRRFDNTDDEMRVKVSGIRHNRDNPSIRRGQLKLSRLIVKSFFDPYVKEILASVSSQVSSARVSHILLVGGFGESPYLYQQLKARFEPNGCLVTRTVEPSSKAVSDGAVIWHCVNYVSKRAPKTACGIEVIVSFDPRNLEHHGRSRVEWPSGTHVHGGWSQIVAKDVPIDCDEVTRCSYRREYQRPDPDLSSVEQPVYRYSFGGIPEWLRSKDHQLHEGFQPECTVSGDLRRLRNALQLCTTIHGSRYWVLNYDVCIRFGRTEIEAFLEWKEGNVTKTGPAALITQKLLI